MVEDFGEVFPVPGYCCWIALFLANGILEVQSLRISLGIIRYRTILRSKNNFESNIAKVGRLWDISVSRN